MHSSQFAANLKGDFGGVYIDGTDEVTGQFDAFLALTDTVIATMTSSNITGTLEAVTVNAGVTFFAHFSAITLTSGTGIAYNAAP